MNKVKVYKVELQVLDFEGHSQEDLVNALENLKYYYPTIRSIDSREITNWSDDHPLNTTSTSEEEFRKLFEQQNK